MLICAISICKYNKAPAKMTGALLYSIVFIFLADQ